MSYKIVNNPYLIRSCLSVPFLCNLESPFEAGGRAPGGMDIARVMGPEVRRDNQGISGFLKQFCF